jgi:3-dehydrosphinganine reductase
VPDHALISGGSSGIGLALAGRLATQGWNLSLLARDAERLAGARDRLGAARTQVFAVDVADYTDTAAATEAAIAAFGPPALVVTSAGIVEPGHFDALPLEAFRRTMEVNYFGTLHLVRAALPAMRRAGHGRIVLIASGAALIGLYGYTAYAPSKFAVRGLGEALRSELAPDGIGVSVVYPPDTDTPQLHAERRTRPEATSRIAAGAKLLSAEQVADAVLAGVRRGKATITPGLEMAALGRLHSLIGPLLHRFWFDPVIARVHRGARQP